jgi:hypothetical protein
MSDHQVAIFLPLSDNYVINMEKKQNTQSIGPNIRVYNTEHYPDHITYLNT